MSSRDPLPRDGHDRGISHGNLPAPAVRILRPLAVTSVRSPKSGAELALLAGSPQLHDGAQDEFVDAERADWARCDIPEEPAECTRTTPG